MKKSLFSLICLFLLALSANAKVFIPLVKNVPPSTSSGGEARTQIRTYPPLAYYEDSFLFIQFPYKSTSTVIISDNGLYVKYETFENVSFAQIDLRSIDKSILYELYINDENNNWIGCLDLYDILNREQTIKIGEEQSITLKIGESRQLLLDPADAGYYWWPDLNFRDNQVLTIDKDGVVTGLLAGESYVRIEPFDGEKPIINFPVTVIENGRIRKGRKSLDPADECEWQEMQYSLTVDGKFIVEGTFYRNGTQPDYIDYIVTDQCIYLDFVINDEADSAQMFVQPFKIEIEGCYAPKYRIYHSYDAQIIETQGNDASKTIVRSSLPAAQDQDVSLVEIANKMFIKKSSEVIQDYINTFLDSKIDGTFQIIWIADDICKVILDGDLITNDIIDGLIKNDAVLEASYVYVPKDDYDLYINNGCPESMEVMISIPTNVYQATDDEVGKVYYNLSGSRIDSPSGLTIVVTRYNDGSIATEKKLFR